MLDPMEPERKDPSPYRGDRIEWFTVRYRTLLLGGLTLVVVAAFAVWFFFLRGGPPPPPPPQAVETGGRFASLEGSVQVKHAGTLEWVGATKATILRRNDLVRTGPGSAAEIVFADGTLISMRPDGLFTIEESSQNPISRHQRVALSIQSGEANFQTAPRTVPGETTISTPTVRTTAERETVGNILVAEGGDTGIRIFQGAGQAETTSGQQIRLTSNEGVQVDADGTAGPKTTLPRVPILTAPPNETEVSYPDPSRAITLLMWNGVAGADAYRVMVDFSHTFARPLFDRRVSENTQMELRGLDTGTYYWKVAAIDEEGMEGSFAPASSFSLLKTPASAAKPPELAVETLELRGNILHVRGQTAPGATVTLNGVHIEVQPDGSFNEFVMYEADATTVVVRATGVSGGVAQQRRPIVVSN
jgi:hypothetical protein